MKRWFCLIVLALASSGCGMMPVPMVDRVSKEDQVRIDQMWHNALTPPNRVDRDDLLGALAVFQMYETGVDRADFHSEKRVDGMRVCMDVHFQRENPQDDGFYLTIYDAKGGLVRSERYSREDVETLRSDGQDSTGANAKLTPAQEQAKIDRFMGRWKAIQAATQPAGWTPPPTTQPVMPPGPLR